MYLLFRETYRIIAVFGVGSKVDLCVTAVDSVCVCGTP
jgi:hypothetical protein